MTETAVVADVYAALGCADLQLEQVHTARTRFVEAIRLYSEEDMTSAGEVLGAKCSSVLHNTATYWALEAEWLQLKDAAADMDERFRVVQVLT
jgi:hypothetical protein